MVSAHLITQSIDREVVATLVFDHPALAGLAVRGFVLSDDKRVCIEIQALAADASADITN